MKGRVRDLLDTIDDPARFRELSETEKKALVRWIKGNLVPTGRKTASSYFLKREFEESPDGFYSGLQ